ncbi:MAG: PfkB family carbohydrate kinase [Ahrensia sp.]
MTRSVAFKLVGIGGAHVDRIGHVDGFCAPGASNPGIMREYVGGGMLNALRVAHWRGIQDVGLVSVRGGDAAALSVEHAIDAAELADLSGRFLDRQTASYTAIHGPDGDVITALADMAIYETCLPRQVRRKPVQQAIAQAAAVMVDANMPASAIATTIAKANGLVFAMAISPAKIIRLADVLARLDCLFANSREMFALTGETTLDAALNKAIKKYGLKTAIVTDGANATTIIAHGAIDARILPSPASVVDVTGAGDALAGATVAALLAGAPLVDAARQAMACAACALAIDGPISQATDLNLFDTHYKALCHEL